jgi:hypothetical protein
MMAVLLNPLRLAIRKCLSPFRALTSYSKLEKSWEKVGESQEMKLDNEYLPVFLTTQGIAGHEGHDDKASMSFSKTG